MRYPLSLPATTLFTPTQARKADRLRAKKPYRIHHKSYYNGQAQFMMLEGISGKWETEFITLQYDRERAIREMDEEKLSEQAPGWYRITKEVLRHGQATHLMTLMKAQELYEQDTGINDWKNIPEQYWNMALEEMKVPK